MWIHKQFLLLLIPCSEFASIQVFPNSIINYFDIKTDQIDFNQLNKNLTIFDSMEKKVDLISSVVKISDNSFRFILNEKHNSGIHYLHIKKNESQEKIRLHLK